jgi:C-terminal processing protease CtpA/Prc
MQQFNQEGAIMKSLATVLTLLLIIVWTFNSAAADKKQIKKERKLWIQASDKKAGLGVLITNIDNETKEKSGVKNGARIMEVFEGSEADEIGLEKGDIIVEVNNKSIKKPSDLVEIMEDVEEGEEITVTVMRDGAKKTFDATVKPFSGHAYAFHVDEDDNDILMDVMRSKHAGDDIKIFKSGDFTMPKGDKGGYLGVQVKTLSGQLQSYFEVKHGVLIEEVIKDSPAEKAGLKAGDVIVSINDRKINDYQDLIRTINYYNPDEEINVIYVRKGNRDEISVVLGKKPAKHWTIKKMKDPQRVKIIGETDNKDFKWNEDGKLKTFSIKKSGCDDDIDLEITEEFFIL